MDLSRADRLARDWEADHRDPVNRLLHYGLGMPLVAGGLFLLARRDRRGVLPIVAGYGIMFAGHYLFEGRPPTVVRHPSGILGAAIHVCRGLASFLTR